MKSRPKLPIPPPASDGRAAPEGKWDWHYRFLQALRERLLQSEEERRKEIFEAQARRGGPCDDAASDESEHELSAALWTAEQGMLNEVDEALERIRRGRYGVCELTGKPIPGERLRAVPWARRLESAESSLEKRGTP